jgi:hypothetical protein
MDIKHVISDFQPYEENQICVEVGSTVRVLEKVNENWWWVESNDDLVGYVPVNHLSDEPLLTDDERWENEEYFEGYGHLKLHSEMLSDAARTSAYKLAIETGAFCMQNKVNSGMSHDLMVRCCTPGGIGCWLWDWNFEFAMR